MRAENLGISQHVARRLVGDRRKGHGVAHVARAAAHAALLPTANLLGHQGSSGAQVQGPARHGPRHLVRGHAGSVNAQLGDVERDVPERLDRVGMDEGAAGMSKLDNTLERLDRADLVVCRHDAHEGNVAAKHGLESIKVKFTVSKNRNLLNAKSLMLK